jgi:nucleotide-binding universal stress UspA family protein
MLIPVDFSASSARAVLQCTRFFPDAVGKFRLMHIVSPKKAKTEEERALAIRDNEFRLSAFASMLSEHGVDTEVVVRIADGREATILKEAEEWNATGIVIGGGGRSSFTTFVIGSTSRGVLLHAKVPVMVVP